MTLLTATDVARRWQCDKTTVYHLARTGALASVRLSPGVVRFAVEVVEEYERLHTVKAQPQTWEELFGLLDKEWTSERARTSLRAEVR